MLTRILRQIRRNVTMTDSCKCSKPCFIVLHLL